MNKILKKWIFIFGALCCYILFAKYRNWLTVRDSHIIAIWIPAGISLVIILLKGYKTVPLVFIGNFLVNFLFGFKGIHSILGNIPLQTSIALINTLEATSVAFFLFLISEPKQLLQSFKNVMLFTVITLVTTLLYAFLGSLVFHSFNPDAHVFFPMLWSWWFGDVLAIALITPIILNFEFHFKFKLDILKIFEYLFFISIIVFFAKYNSGNSYPFKFALYPFFLLFMLRFGNFVAFSTIFALSLMITILNSHLLGSVDYERTQTLTEFQLYFGVASFLLLVVSSIVEDQRKVKNSILKINTKFQSIFDSINDAMILCDVKTCKIIDSNDFATNWLGFSKPEFKVMTITDLILESHDYSKENLLKHFKKAVSKPQNFKWQFKDKSGRLYHCDIQLTNVQLFENDNIIASIRDITEKYEQEQNVINAYIEAQEDDRQYFGEEIHDNISQILSAENIYIGTLANMDYKNCDERNQITDMVGKLKTLNLNAINQIQHIAYGLMSKQLKDEGLIDALNHLCIDYGTANKIKITFSQEHCKDIQIKDIIQTNLFRIVQELFNFLNKNIQEAPIQLKLSKTQNNTLELEMFDEANIFDYKSLNEKHNGRALKNINRRLQFLNGKLSIKDNADMSLKITIPLS